MKKTREFHYNESENISGESMGGAALIQGWRLIDAEGGAYSSKYVICLPHFLGKRIELEIMGAKSC